MSGEASLAAAEHHAKSLRAALDARNDELEEAERRLALAREALEGIVALADSWSSGEAKSQAREALDGEGEELSPNHPASGNLSAEEMDESGYDGPMLDGEGEAE